MSDQEFEDVSGSIDSEWAHVANSAVEVKKTSKQASQSNNSVDEIRNLMARMGGFGNFESDDEIEPAASIKREESPERVQATMAREESPERVQATMAREESPERVLRAKSPAAVLESRQNYKSALMGKQQKKEAEVKRNEYLDAFEESRVYAQRYAQRSPEPARIYTPTRSKFSTIAAAAPAAPAAPAASASRASRAAPVGRLGNLDTIMSRGGISKEKTEGKSKAHPSAVKIFVDHIKQGLPLRDVHISCEDGDRTHMFEVRAQPIPGNEHVIAFATNSKLRGAKPITFAALDLHATNDNDKFIHNHEHWAEEVSKEPVSEEHAISIAENMCELINAIAREL